MTKRSTKTAQVMREYLFNILDTRHSPCDPELWRVMKEISDYISASFYLGINPLVELRRILPQFQWRFNEVRTLKALKIEVCTADVMWRTDWSASIDGHYKIVTADKWEQTVARQLLFVDEDKDLSPALAFERQEFVRQLDCIPVSGKLLANT